MNEDDRSKHREVLGIAVQEALLSAAKQAAGPLRRHPGIAAFAAITCLAVLAESFWFGKLPQRLAYLGAIAISVFVVDLFTVRQRAAPLPVRRPRLELAIAAGCLVFSICWLFLHFNAAPAGKSTLAAILFRLAGALVVFNIPIALIDLLALRYRLGDLGFRFAAGGLWAVPLILVCFFGLAYLSGATCTINDIIREEGSLWRAVPVAIFVAALPEEFFRMTWQTRFGAVTGNAAAAWFLTAFLWSFMHAPIFHNGEPTWPPALISCLNLVPLGLLWGYVLHRTRSLVPSMILHIFNVSGLQNF
jgi:membrane protease YdiL (CAAX protease family)